LLDFIVIFAVAAALACNLLLWQQNVFCFMAHKMHNVYALDLHLAARVI